MPSIGLLADIVDLARLGEASQDLPALGLASHALTEKTIVPINDIESAFSYRIDIRRLEALNIRRLHRPSKARLLLRRLAHAYLCFSHILTFYSHRLT